ncbi:MAG: mandelate racemase/muconate lactonizing enzyme family protein [Trueperaceae bacterium]
MVIDNVRAFTLRLPLEKPVRTSNLLIESREYVLVEVSASNGEKGYGFGFTRGGLIAESIERNLAPSLLGQDIWLSESLWSRMYLSTRYLGRKGLMMRAISAVDIALWDLKGKTLGIPVWKLLGGAREQVPTYVAGGYYREDDSPNALADEFRRYQDQGFNGAKMNLGGAKRIRDDLTRLEIVRSALGDECELMVDFNGALRSAKEALIWADELARFDIAFIEEPFLMDNLPAMREFYPLSRIPVAIGEDESGRWAFRELLSPRVLDILRHDATLAGGVSEWVKIAHLGLAHGVTLFPHWFPEVHIHLAAAFPDSRGVELITLESGLMNFHRLVRNPVENQGGFAPAPEGPGLGLEWNWQEVERFTQK